MPRKFKRTTLICTGLFAVLVGVAIARVLKIGLEGVWIFAALLLFVAAARKRQFASILTIMLLGITIGIWRGGIFLQKVAPYKEFSGQKITVQVRAESSAIYGKSSQMEFDASHVKIMSPYRVDVPGMMVISGYGENSVLRGDVVTVSGKMYTRRGGKQAGISFGQIHVDSRSASQLEKLRRNFLAGLNTALPEPHNQFAAGLLIGQRNELPDDITLMLRTVGLSHVIAVSGYNLTIIAEVIRKRMGKKSKYRSTLASVGLILFFVAIAGSSASIARAAFVSLLTVAAAHHGRSVKPLLLILLAAAYTTYMNPLNIWVDIGWYLSFLAFFGVLIVAPSVQKRLFSSKKPNGAVQLLIETSSAQLMTVPIVMYIFGEVSMIALVANVLVVPLVPLAMLLSVFAGFGGMLFPVFAGLLAWPARMVLGFMLTISSLLSRIPHALSTTKISAGVMVLLYLVVIVMVIVMRRRSDRVSAYAKIAVD